MRRARLNIPDLHLFQVHSWHPPIGHFLIVFDSFVNKFTAMYYRRKRWLGKSVPYGFTHGQISCLSFGSPASCPPNQTWPYYAKHANWRKAKKKDKSQFHNIRFRRCVSCFNLLFVRFIVWELAKMIWLNVKKSIGVFSLSHAMTVLFIAAIEWWNEKKAHACVCR